jgi:hypothetical protein
MIAFSDLPFELRIRIINLAKESCRREAFRRRCAEFERRYWMIYQKKRMRRRSVVAINPAARIVYRWFYHTRVFSIDEIIPAPQFSIEPYYRHQAHSSDALGCLLYSTSSNLWSCTYHRPEVRHGRCRACRTQPMRVVYDYAPRRQLTVNSPYQQRKITDYFPSIRYLYQT